MYYSYMFWVGCYTILSAIFLLIFFRDSNPKRYIVERSIGIALLLNVTLVSIGYLVLSYSADETFIPQARELDIIAIVITNLVTFVYYMKDKVLAKTPQRTPEKTLLMLSSVGGFIGAGIAMLLFKHKISTRKNAFFIWYSATIALNLFCWSQVFTTTARLLHLALLAALVVFVPLLLLPRTSKST